MNLKKLDEAARALLKMKPPGDKQSPPPTKEDLERKFRLDLDKDGSPNVKEVA